MREPAGIFDGENEEDMDISGFTKKPDTKIIKEAAESLNFQSREPIKKVLKKTDRRYRTGRNIPLSAKINERANVLLYKIYDGHKDSEGNPKWTIGQIIEFGLQAFQRELDSGKTPE